MSAFVIYDGYGDQYAAQKTSYGCWTWFIVSEF